MLQCLRSLLDQRENGSWNNSIEQTSYGILVLAEARKLSFFEDIQPQLELAMRSAVEFIGSFDDRPLEVLWIEKVTYSSTLLAEAYKLAALKASTATRCSPGSRGVGVSVKTKVSSLKMTGYIKLAQSTPMFSKLPTWQIQASFLEATLFQPLLRARRLGIFPRENMEEDKYFDMIPFIWALCNNHTLAFASTTFLFDMMVISFLNFQADEFMEAMAGPAFAGNLSQLRHIVNSLFTQHSNGLQNGNGSVPPSSGDGSASGTNGHGMVSETNGNGTTDEADISGPLKRFVGHVLNRPAVASASSWDRKRLEQELQTYLLSHVRQVEDNLNLSRQDEKTTYQTSTTFFDWVRTTSSDQTSGPYAFALVCCMMSSSSSSSSSTLCNNGSAMTTTECFRSASQKYYAQALCRHLSTMCRMYNDYGSMDRDAAEGNLSSLNFPEFGALSREGRKRELYELAEYERVLMDGALERLDRQADKAASPRVRRAEKRKLAVWRVFVDVTDLHGQIYVVRDIASRIKAQRQQGASRANGTSHSTNGH